MKRSELLEELDKITTEHIARIEKFYLYNDDILSSKKGNDWSVLECLEHLNYYCEYYLPQIAIRINRSTPSPHEHFTEGLIGGYMAKSMLPKAKMQKMKSPANKNPFGKQFTKSSIERLINHLAQLQLLLSEAKNYNLDKVLINTSFSKFIKLKLGDTLRFIVNHNERHIQQAEKLL